jgi:serine/threonine protein kinase
MSVTFLDPSLALRDRSLERAAPTTDLESTTDLQGDTTDLGPVTSTPETQDIDPAAIVSTSGLNPVDVDESAPLARSVATPKPLARELAPGAVLCDRYILEQVVGTGGTAVVYEARDMTSSTSSAPNSRVALKVPRADSDGTRANGRLRHEFEHAQKLSHPSIVRVFDLHEDADCCFMTMELLEGRLLSTIVRDWTMLPRPLANKILHACAKALDHAHAHAVIHGDFKPGNVFVTHDEEVKILDFGASTAPSGGTSRIPAGTPAYASPQVLSGETPDQRDDIFSFACVAYELLTGQHPFEHRSSLEARELGKAPARAWSLSATQWLALLSALSWEREQRPSDIDTLLDMLIAESEPVAATVPIRRAEVPIPRELPQEMMPTQRGWGFFMFVACTIAVIFIAWQRQGGPVDATLPALTNSVVGAVERTHESAAGIARPDTFATPRAASTVAPTADSVAPAAAEVPPKPAPAGPLSEISFESASIITTESSVAAVFLIKRSQPLRGRIRVQWTAISGTADAGIDFASNATGSVEFADGQAQRAIYVPLRNDLLKEGDETFTIRLVSPQNARVGSKASAQASIRDDD